MAEDMGIFRTRVGIESLGARGTVRYVDDVMVDTGSEMTWLPAAFLESMGIEREDVFRFRMADGRVIARDTGYAILHAGGAKIPDAVVFAVPGDLPLLGARTIEGLNFTVDLANKEFVAAGPMPV
jgi:predicted aspartyl protease